MSFKVIIPARFASSRLPGKPLREIAGKTMIEHVYERARESDASEVIVATDDVRIADAVKDFGGTICLTRADHRSGTDRLAEVVEQHGIGDDEIIINVQGDEPTLPAALIDQVAGDMQACPDAAIATLCRRINEVEDIFDPNIVKVVTDAHGYALYFSRAPIPWQRDAFAEQPPRDAAGCHFRHIGLYGYRAGFLRDYPKLVPSPAEHAESLEQLRALHHGFRIHLTEAQIEPGHGVDTEADLARVREMLT